MGDLNLVLIESKDGVWEEDWEPLRNTIFGKQFTLLPRLVVEQAFHRWTKPLVQGLGICPQGALRKIPLESRACFRRKVCPLFDSTKCYPEAKNMQWCFEPDGVTPESTRLLATQAIELWRSRVYLVVMT